MALGRDQVATSLTRAVLAGGVIALAAALSGFPPAQTLDVEPQRVAFNLLTAGNVDAPVEIELHYWGIGDQERISISVKPESEVTAIQLFVSAGSIAGGPWTCTSELSADASTSPASTAEISTAERRTAREIDEHATDFYPAFNLEKPLWSQSLTISNGSGSRITDISCQREGDLWPALGSNNRYFAPPITTVAVDTDSPFTLTTRREITFPGDAEPTLGIVRYENGAFQDSVTPSPDGLHDTPARWRDQTLWLRDTVAEAQTGRTDIYVAGAIGAGIALLIEFVVQPLRKRHVAPSALAAGPIADHSMAKYLRARRARRR